MAKIKPDSNGANKRKVGHLPNPILLSDSLLRELEGDAVPTVVLQHLLQALPDSLFLVSPDKRIIACNPIAANRLQGKPEDLIGTDLFGYFPQEVAKFREEKFQEVLDSKAAVRFEDGRHGIFFDTTFLPMLDEVGEVRCVAAFAHEITSRHIWEQELENNRSLLESILDATEDGIHVVKQDGTVLFSNKRFQELWNIPDELMEQMDDSALLECVLKQLEDPESFLARVQDIYQTDSTEFDTFRFKDGRIFERLSRPLLDKSTVKGRVWSFRDVTKRKQAEVELATSELRFQNLVEQSPLGTVIYAPTGRPLYANPAQQKTMGITSEQLNHLLESYNVFQDQQLIDNGLIKFIKKGFAGDATEIPPVYYESMKIDPAAGIEREPLWLKAFVFPVRDALGDVAEVVITFEDFTEKVEAEKALTESEERYRLLVEEIGEGMAIADENEVFRFVNPMAEEIFGLKPGTMQGKKFLDFIRKDDLDWVVAKTRERRKKKKDTYDVQIVRPDGELRNLVITAVPQLNENDEFIGSLSVFRDITEQKSTEESLRKYRERLELHFQQTPLGVIDWDPEFRVASWNPAAEKIFGYLRAEAMGRSARDLILSNDVVPVVDDIWNALLKREGGYRSTNHNITKDGKTILCEWYNTPLVDSDGTIIGISSLVMDITTRQQAEDSLRENEERWRTIITNSQAIIFMMDRDGKFVLSEGDGLKVLGLKPGEVVGMDAFEIYKDAPGIIAGMKRAYEGETERRLVEFSGIHFDVWFSPYMDQNGEITGLMGMAVDITEQVKAEADRRKLESQIQHVQKLESLGVLAGGIAHDFNNLLMAILGNTDLALGEISSISPARGRLDEIEKASRRAAELCQQMLAYSGKGRFVIEPLDISELVSEMAHILEVSISKKAMLRYNFSDDLPPVDADPTQLRQIVMNLITNASEAIGDQSGIISLNTGVIECDRAYLRSSYLDEELSEGQYVFIEVSDTGCGMDADTRARLFDPFFTTKFTGRGLGLSAVLGIMRGHHGAIKIYTEPGKGSTFKVLFPAGEGFPATAEIAAINLEDWMGTGTVLLVDDDSAILTVGKAMLERLGFDVITAPDGVEAVEVFRGCEQKPVCSIIDLTMPRMDGEQTFREIRKLDSKAPIIISSGYNEQEVTQRFPGKGLAGFLQKPYRVNDLVERLKEVLKK